MDIAEIMKFLKRYSPLFSVNYGKANRLHQHYAKFLCDRNGLLDKYFSPDVEYETIEEEIVRLLGDKFSDEEYDLIINPPEEMF